MDPKTGETWGSLSHQESLPHQNTLGSLVAGTTDYNWAEFDAIRQISFQEVRRAVFHYVVAAHSGPNQRFAGVARGIPAADFLMAMHDNCVPTTALDTECAENPEWTAATFMHELGHTLGLQHGGNEGAAYKPNYLSIMNYNFGFGLIDSDGDYSLDYSRFELSLTEFQLDEQRGFGFDSGPLTAFRTIYHCSSRSAEPGQEKVIPLLTAPVDWTCDGEIQRFLVAEDVSNDGQQTVLTAPIDWDRIIFNGGGIGGFNPPPPPATTAMDEPTPAETIANRVLLDAGLSPQPELLPPPDTTPPDTTPPDTTPPDTTPPDTTPPETTIDGSPKEKLTKPKAKVAFSASEPSSTFECKLDKKPFKGCTSPTKLKRLKPGKHTFEVRAIDPAGNVDATPAKYRFKVVR